MYLYQEKPLRSVFKEYLPVPVPRETFDIGYLYREKLLRSVFKEYLPQLPRIQEFMAYYETTWLVGSYPLPLWNVFESGSTRTNNHVEGWLNRLKKVVGKAHPNVFEIVETFKKEQASTEVSIAQLATGAAPTRRNRRAIN